ncbi:hypothetical protein KAR28_03005 [Candidatus Parcubacteria bacterium]|nr:hypothetical protein [Candidatus Parcubacteria bacterium]
MIEKYLKETFYVLTGAVLIFALLEFIHQGIVIAYLNFNIILLLWLTNGIIVVVIKQNKND